MSDADAIRAQQKSHWDGAGGETWVDAQSVMDAMFEEIESRLAASAAQSGASRILDIGCGTGAVSLAAARAAPSAHLTGIDISGPMLALARNRASATEIDVDFIKADKSRDNFVRGAEGLLMAPAQAVPRMLGRLGLGLGDFDFYEIHEAFAAQVLCTLAAWEDDRFAKEYLGQNKAFGSIDRTKLNVKGGSLAMGHPFAATGARIVGSLAKIIEENKGGRGLISICAAGGMGVTAVLEG